MKKHLLKVAVASCALVLAAVPNSANATAALRWSLDGSTWTTVQDNAAGDSLASLGKMNVTITIGTWVEQVAVSLTKPALGSEGSPELDFAITGTSGATPSGGKLYIEFTDTGFTPLPSGSFITSVGGNLTRGITGMFQTRVSGDNQQFGVGTTITTLNGFGEASAAAPADLGIPYSITLLQVITSAGVNGTISTDQHLMVPDGGSSLVLLGLSLLGLAGFRRKA